MIKPAYRSLGAAFAASLILYPAAQPMLNPTGSNTRSSQPLLSSTNGLALDGLTLEDILAIPVEDHVRYRYALAELERKEIGATGLIQREEAMPRQQVTQRIKHPIHIVPIRRERVGDRSNDTPLCEPRITNIQSFSGPDYGRVMIDLSSATNYVAERPDNNRVVIRMAEASILPSLDQNIITLGESGLIKQIVLAGAAGQNAARAAGVDVVIDVALNSEYSILRRSDPSRIVIELRSKVPQSRPPSPANQLASAIPFVASQSLENERVGPVDQEQSSTHSRLIKCIVIDAGHGGHDPGAISPNGIPEKEVVFDIAQRLRDYIKSRYPDVEAVLTRESDYFITLDQRVTMANCRGADLFLSIHANASKSPAASGVETYYLNPNSESSRPLQFANGEDLGLSSKSATSCESSGVSPRTASFSFSNRLEESEEFARHLQTALVRGIGSTSPPAAKDRGVKHASFAVLLGAKMPSVLAEVSFLSNPRDAELLRSTQFRERIAASLFSGLDGYLKNRSVEPTQNSK